MADFQQGRQTVVDRLKRRLNNYRNHSTVSNHHFDTTVDAIYGDQHKQTLLLKQRHIESKVKKNPKKSDKKQDSSSLLSAMGQSKLLARGHDQAAGSGEVMDSEPAAKKQRIANGALVNSAPPDASEFQIVQQLHNIKTSNSPSSAMPQSGVAPPNSLPNASMSSLGCVDPVETALGDGSLAPVDGDDSIKKENDLDLPSDSLLEDFGELSNLDDIDMGINLEDFVHDLDLDNIKHENSNSGMDTFFKEEVVENLFDDPPPVSSDATAANGNKSTQMPSAAASAGPNKMPSSVASPVYLQYSNPSHVASSAPPTSFSFSSSALSQQFCSTASSLSTPFTMATCLPKMRLNPANMAMGQNDMVLAAQTLKQMAEQHQTKLSPTGTTVRSNMADFSYNNISGTPMMSQSTSVPNAMFNNLNQASPMYSQGMGGDMELKRRQQQQQMMQQFSLQHMSHQQSTGTHCNQPGAQAQSPGIQQGQAQQHQHKQIQQQQPQPQSLQHSQTPHSQPSTHHQATQQQQAAQIQQQTPQQQQQATSQLQQQTATGPQAQPQAVQQQTTQQQQQQSQMRNSLSPFSNRMSPLNSYVNSPQAQSQMGMSPQFVNAMCPGLPNSSVRGGSYPAPTRGSSPIPAGPQGQPSNLPISSGPQPRFLQQQQQSQQQQQQQMMGSVAMMRPQMMAQSGQMIARPPPPEYRQAAMMQQAMIGEPMSQPMPQMHQGMGQMPPFQGMRAGFRPNMGGSPVGSMGGAQMMPGMGQQNIPANLPSMKSPLMQGGIPTSIGGPMGQGAVGPQGMGSACMSVSMNQVSGGGANMGMVNTRPPMMQRTRAPNINMGIPGMGTQMPASRPEWRQMMMQQNQTSMIMGPGIRHSYQQPQGGGMLGQGNPMIVQRPQSHLMNMVGMQGSPSMQHTVSMSSGPSMQGSPVSISGSHTNPAMQTLGPPGVRMPQQHGPSPMGPGQVHPGLQMSQPGMHDSRAAVNMASQGHGGSPSGLAAMGVTTPTSMGHHGASVGPPSMNQMGGNAPPSSGMNHMNSTNMSPLPQGAGVPSTTAVNPASQTPTAGMNAHPRSPATLNQMHPCSPAAAGAGVQQRPLSNPSLGLTPASQPQSNTGSGSCSPLLTGSSSSGIMATSAQARQTLVVGSLSQAAASGRQTLQSNSVPQGMGGLVPGGVGGPVQQGHPIGQPSGGNLPNSGPAMMSQGSNGAVSGLGGGAGSQRPDSRGGNGVKPCGDTPTPNPTSGPTSNSASTDFDLMFNEGEFAALLS